MPNEFSSALRQVGPSAAIKTKTMLFPRQNFCHWYEHSPSSIHTCYASME